MRSGTYVNEFSEDEKEKAISSREMAERHRAAIVEIFRCVAKPEQISEGANAGASPK